ncbi:MAG: PEP-CTERM sorting domain-containing protein, partial [Planctomycetota bacterium]
AIPLGTITKTGTGTLTLTGQNEAAMISIDDGTVEVNSNSFPSVVGIGDGATLRILESFALNDSIINGVSGTATVDTGGFDLNNVSMNVVGDQLVKSGEGTLQLKSGTASNSPGALVVHRGTLAARPGTAGSLILDGGEFLATQSNYSVIDEVRVTANGGVYNVSNNTVGLEGNLTGAGLLTKSGTGQLVLEGVASSFFGTVRVSQGSLVIASADAIANDNSIQIDSNASLRFDTAVFYGGALSGSGILRVFGGDVQLAGNNVDYAGSIVVHNGRTLLAGLGNSLGRETGLNILTGGRVEIQSDAYWGSLEGSGTLDANNVGNVRFGYNDENFAFSGEIVGSTSVGKYGAGDFSFFGDASALGGEFRLVTGAMDGDGVLGDLHVFHGATLSPGSSPGTMTASSLLLDSGSMLVIELGGTGAGIQHDQINLAGDLTLAGELHPTLIDGYVPGALDTFTIATFGTLTGDFDIIQNQQLDNDLLLIPDIQPTQYDLVAAIPGDFDLNGAVGVPDLIRWAQNFGAADATFQLGDADLDATVGVPDLIAWAQRFGQTAADFPGTPATVSVLAAATAIPEPSSLAVACVVAIGLAGRRRRWTTD